MQNLKISLITVTYNAEDTIKRCIESVFAQDYTDLEYIIIDGGSTDNTTDVIATYKHRTQVFVTEPDCGIYDAMNKGLKFASGDIIGTLNADDFFAATDVLTCVAGLFNAENADILYGNLNYVNPKGTIIRKWVAGEYHEKAFNWGWMPPHPTFYCKKWLFKEFGGYDINYGSAADYELMLRFMHLKSLKVFYLNKLMVKMAVGGVSNKNLRNRMTAWNFDLKAMRKNGVFFPHLALMLKPLRKFSQYFRF